MLNINVTGKIMEVTPAPDSDEVWAGSLVIEESYFFEGARFARYWRVYLPAYLRSSMKKLCATGKYIGVTSEWASPATDMFKSQPVVADLKARSLFIL